MDIDNMNERDMVELFQKCESIKKRVAERIINTTNDDTVRFKYWCEYGEKRFCENKDEAGKVICDFIDSNFIIEQGTIIKVSEIIGFMDFCIEEGRILLSEYNKVVNELMDKNVGFIYWCSGNDIEIEKNLKKTVSNTNVFEIIIPKGKLVETLERLNKHGLTKEELKKCKETAEMYKNLLIS